MDIVPRHLVHPACPGIHSYANRTPANKVPPFPKAGVRYNTHLIRNMAILHDRYYMGRLPAHRHY